MDAPATSPDTQPVRREMGSGQLTMWQVHNLLTAAAAANRTEELWIRGALDVAALQHALETFVQRHPQLRTGFVLEEGLPTALEYPRVAFRLRHATHLTQSPADDPRLRALLDEEAALHFDLAQPPLFRALLVELGDSRWVLVITSHHIVTDATSGVVLLGDELAALYNAARAKLPDPLPPPEKTFADFVAWQRSRNDDKWRPRWLKFADKVLDGAPAYLDLPTDRPRPPRPTGKGAVDRRPLQAGLRERVQSVADELGARPFDVLLAAFYGLLHRYSNADDIVLGTPHAARGQDGFDQIYGCLMNPLVVRCKLDGQPTFAELVKRVQSATMKAFAYADLTVESLFEHRVGPRDPSRSPIYQVMFNYLNFPAFAASWDGLEIDNRRGDPAGAMIDITFDVAEEVSGLVATTNYNTDVFLPSSARRMLGHYDNLLAAAVADPQAKVVDLQLLGEDESELLGAWNQTDKDYPSGLTLHALMRQQTEKTPDRTAVSDGERQWSYRELEERANQLAHCLRDHGVRPEVGVCLLLDRALEMVLALHGVNRSSGAWVPLGPDNATARLAHMLSEIEPPVILTQAHLRDRLPPTDAKVICLDSQWDAEVARYPVSPPPDDAGPQTLAYIFYTSGSTGRPKGVMNEHRGIVNRLHWMQDAFNRQPDDRVLQKTPYTFDCSIWEFYWPLMVGGSIEVAAPDEHKDPRALVRRVKARDVTTMHFVPSMLDAFVDYEASGECSSLRRVLCNGEALPFDLCERFFERFDGVELHNLYGPTEAAVGVTHWPCTPDPSLGIIPIGRPTTNCRVHVLDAQLRPTPIGIPGELHIGGVQVARGYHARDELTAERFLPDPFGGERLYKTGDLARWIDEGVVEFMGRLDFQVKLRGFRIELGDIESNLLASPTVRQAAVLLREDRPGDKRLVGYVVAEEGETPDEEELKVALLAHLPSYMVPSRIVTIDAFPTNASGKLDRKQLPAPPQSAEDADVVRDPPRGPTEERLAAIWKDLLGVEELGRDDDFFALGGNSISAVRLVGRIEQQLGVEISLGVVFEAPTIAGLAGHLDSDDEGGERAVISLQAGDGKLPLFCICGIHLYSKLAKAIGPHQTVYGVYLEEEGQMLRAAMSDPGSVELDVRELASKYLDAVVATQPKGPYCLAGVSFGGVLSFEIARQLRARGEDVAMLALLDTVLPSGMTVDIGMWAKAQLELIESEGAGWFMHKTRRATQFALSRAKGLLPWLPSLRPKAKPGVPGGGGVAAFQHRVYTDAMRRWESTPKPYDGPVFFAAAADHTEAIGRRIDPLYGWEPHVEAEFSICVVPGTHIGILDDPGVEPLGRHLERQLRRARALR